MSLLAGDPERRVWGWLDRHGVPFREATDRLADLHGTNAEQPSGRPLCALRSSRDVVPGQRGPLAFEPGMEAGPPAPPRRLWTSVYDGESPEASFHGAARALRRALGPGQDDGASNTLGHVWTHGLAEVRLTLWPRDLNRGSQYAYPDPLRFKASVLSVEPGWVEALRDDERAAMKRAERLHREAPRWSANAPAAHWRRRPLGARDGVHLASGTVFAVGDRVLAIGREHVAAVTWLDIRPGKGGGGSSVILETAHGARISVADGAHGELRSLAERLAEWAGVDLNVEGWVDT